LPIRVKLVYFGQARDAAGMREETFTLPDRSSVDLLLTKTSEAHEKIDRIKGMMKIAVNEELVDRSQVLRDGDVVALLPPVAGGRR
jgi:molybdopterin converting factor subunit 1